MTDQPPVPPSDRTLSRFLAAMWANRLLQLYLVGVAIIGAVVVRGDAAIAWVIAVAVGLCGGSTLRYRKFRRTGRA